MQKPGGFGRLKPDTLGFFILADAPAMQQTIVAALERAILNILPRLEPLLIQAAKNVASGLINAAKAKTLPERYKWLEPIIDQVGDQLLVAINQP